MLRRVGLLLLAASLLVPHATYAANTSSPQNKGLFITPLRSFVSVQPGKTAGGTFTIANITNAPITVTLSVEQFSVADYTYDYQFTQTRDDWVRLSQTEVALQPNQNQKLSFTTSPPATTTPGGHYFTIFATTRLQKNDTSEVRAATVLYATVEGAITTSSKINSASIPAFSFGGDISFSLNVKDTGNTHFFAYTSGRLEGFSARPNGPEATNLLLPNASRIIGSTIPAPILPGIYKAVFGYRTDTDQTVQRASYIVYIPPWSALLPIGLAWLIFAVRRRKR